MGFVLNLDVERATSFQKTCSFCPRLLLCKLVIALDSRAQVIFFLSGCRGTEQFYISKLFIFSLPPHTQGEKQQHLEGDDIESSSPWSASHLSNLCTMVPWTLCTTDCLARILSYSVTNVTIIAPVIIKDLLHDFLMSLIETGQL